MKNTMIKILITFIFLTFLVTAAVIIVANYELVLEWAFELLKAHGFPFALGAASMYFAMNSALKSRD